MSTQDVILEKFKKLLADGHAVLASCGWDGRHYARSHPGNGEYLRFRTEALNLIRRTRGEDSDHYRELRRLAEDERSANNGFYLAHCLGAAEAAERDFEGNLLFDLRAIVAAELLGDFLDQAEFLVSEGYYVPAASLTGAVLEDTLRKLCEKRGLPHAVKTNIDRLNADLAKAGIYDKLIQKRIIALADIRNNADHGHFDKFDRDDVEDMVK